MEEEGRGALSGAGQEPKEQGSERTSKAEQRNNLVSGYMQDVVHLGGWWKEEIPEEVLKMPTGRGNVEGHTVVTW